MKCAQDAHLIVGSHLKAKQKDMSSRAARYFALTVEFRMSSSYPILYKLVCYQACQSVQSTHIWSVSQTPVQKHWDTCLHTHTVWSSLELTKYNCRHDVIPSICPLPGSSNSALGRKER